MKLYLNNINVPVIKCKFRPTFNTHRGRTWDSGEITIDDVKKTVHLDTSWGQYIYFQHGENNEWFKIKMWSDYKLDLQGKGWDVDPFGKTKLTTKIVNE